MNKKPLPPAPSPVMPAKAGIHDLFKKNRVLSLNRYFRRFRQRFQNWLRGGAEVGAGGA